MTTTLRLLLAVAISTLQSLDPRELGQKIDARGAQVTLLELYDDSAAWQLFLEHVSTAAPEWLRLANRLAPASDAGSANELEMSLGDALIQDPRAVLGAIDDISLACGMFTSPETLDELVPAIVKREVAVAAIGDSSLQSKKKLCLSNLKELRESLLKPIKTPARNHKVDSVMSRLTSDWSGRGPLRRRWS